MEDEYNTDDDKQYDFDIQYSLKDEHFYQLPDQIPCDFQGKKITEKVYYGYIQLITKYQNLPEETKAISQSIVQQFQEMLKIWDVPINNQHYSYPFQFPPSTFKHKIDIFGKYPQIKQVEMEYNEVQDLSKEQISSIFQRGTFEIPSKMFPIPYVWKLSTWVIKGREPINKSLNFDIGYAYNSIRTITQRIYREDNDEFNLTLAKGLKNLVIKTLAYISILIGFRQMVEQQEVERIYNEIEADRQFKLLQMPNINKAIYLYLRKTEYNQIESNEKYRNLQEFANGFNKDIEGIKFQMNNLWDLMEQQNNRILNVEDEEEKEYKGNIQAQLAELKEDYIDKYGIQVLSDQHIDEQIQNAIHQAQRIYWESNSQFDKELIQNIINIAECFRIYDYYQQVMDAELNKQLAEFENKLIQDHPIRIHCDLYKNSQIENFHKQLKKDLQIETDNKILFDLKDLGEVQIYQEYIQNWKEYKRLAKNRIAQNLYLTKDPNIKVNCTRKCFPPYKVLHDGYGYHLERERTYKVDSRCFGWKIQLLFVRWFTWSVTVMFWLFANAISGPIGIRALFSINEFHPDVQIDRETGRIYPSGYTVQPVIVLLQMVYKGMRDSRNEFENAPDTGFFGKNCARICNLFEVYIFRFLIVGVLIVIILMPITIIINFVVSLTLAITAFAWIPICLLFWYIFSVTIYDFDVEHFKEKNLFYTPPLFPFIVNTCQLLWYGIFQTTLCLLLILIFQPALAFFTLIFALLRYILRSLYDCFMILFVRCFGRVPVFENNLAWKISGPGQSIKHFYAVSMEQLIILVAAELEKCVLEQYNKNICLLINAPSLHISKIINPFFKQFNANFQFNDPGCQKLFSTLDKQISQKLQLLPKITVSIKFTQLELLHALKITKQFLKTQIILKDLSEYIWEKYAIRKGDYNSLVEKLLTLIFGSQIFEPFEDVDMRFSLDQTESQKLMNQVQKALKGKINLEIPHNYTIKKKDLKKREIIMKYIQYIEILGNIWSSQWKVQQWSSLKCEKRRFLLNYSLANCL